MGLERLRLCDDVSPAQWIVDCIHPFAQDVGSIVPEGFGAYARIFHPAERNEGEGRVPVRWSEVAEANGRIAHPEMQWPTIALREPYSNWRHPGLWDREPNEGSLPADLVPELVEVLRRHTSTPDRVWFAVWNGYSGLAFDDSGIGTIDLSAWPGSRIKSGKGLRTVGARRQPPSAPTFELPGRAYWLLSGPIDAATESLGQWQQSANLWWPEDRAWCVATEIDFSWTYLGGTESLIDEVLSHPSLEAMRAEIAHGVTWDSDHLNR
jgi:hypothetical protein